MISREELRRTTAPALVCRRARATPDAIAFRAKHRGFYRERSWRDYAGLVARCARAFSDLGVGAGDRVAIMGDACEEWVICDQAAQALGAIVYGVYPTASVSEVEHLMRDGGAVLFVAEDQEYVDRILPLIERLPALRHVVVIDDSAMFAYTHPQLRSYAELMADAGDVDLDWLEGHARALDPAAPAFIVYTSGTTGPPKGALVSHGKHLAATFNIVEHYPELREQHRTVVYLPLCHILGRDVAITLPLSSGLVPHFGEDIEDLPQTLFEVAPTVLFAVPRYLEKLAAQILVGVGNTSRVKRTAYDLAIRIARAHVSKLWDERATLLDRSLYGLARLLVLRPILNKIGFDQLALAICGGAPMPPQMTTLWHMYGVNVVEIYGQTEEAGAIVTGQPSPFPRPGNVGTAPPGWEVRLAEDGEVLVRSPDLFDGYWGNDEATRAVKRQDGWLGTGDIGEWRDGALRLIDRARDFIVTSGGKTLSPSFIETAVRASPYVAEAVVFGHGRKYLTALIEIDYETVADWARANDVSYTGFTNLTESPQVVALIQSEIERANGELSRVEQIKLFRILPKALDPEEEGEPVTPTRKVKRTLMYERFKSLVDGMYDDAEERLIAASVNA